MNRLSQEDREYYEAEVAMLEDAIGGLNANADHDQTEMERLQNELQEAIEKLS